MPALIESFHVICAASIRPSFKCRWNRPKAHQPLLVSISFHSFSAFILLRDSPTESSNRSPGKSSPLRGRCVKEYEEQLQQLQHENFNLKLRVFLLEERVGKALGRDAADIIKNNIELKVENETLKKSLTDKCQLLTQASGAIEDLESQQRSTLVAHQAEVLALREQLDDLQKVISRLDPPRSFVVHIVQTCVYIYRSWLMRKKRVFYPTAFRMSRRTCTPRLSAPLCSTDNSSPVAITQTITAKKT